MKKILLSSILIMVMAGYAKAEKPDFQEVINSTITAFSFSCSSGTTPVLIDSTTTANALFGRAFAAFQNQDTSNNVCIGFNAISSCPTDAPNGSVIVPKNYGLVSIPLGLFKAGGSYQSKVLNLWCLSESTTGASTVTLIQGK